MHVEKPTHT